MGAGRGVGLISTVAAEGVVGRSGIGIVGLSSGNGAGEQTVKVKVQTNKKGTSNVCFNIRRPCHLARVLCYSSSYYITENHQEVFQFHSNSIPISSIFG